MAALPIDPKRSTFEMLYELIADYDIIIAQRCPKYNTLRCLKDVCDLLGKPFVFDTDDDYINISPDNPGYEELSTDEAKAKFIEILKMADAITVPNEELKRVYYPYNSNIKVFPNNVEFIPCGESGLPKRDIHEARYSNGNKTPDIISKHGIMCVPGYWKGNNEIHRTVRIGYTGTISHAEDFEEIRPFLEKIIKHYRNKIWTVFIGDDYFFKSIAKNVYMDSKQVVHIPITIRHDQYLNHIRNLDIGIAPLKRNIFNMARSSIKAIEYAQWGIPSVLPNYITYTREFSHGKNCLLYNNSKEFRDALELLIENEKLRNALGAAARDHIRDFRLERLHSEERFFFLRDLVNKNRPVYRFAWRENGTRSTEGS